MAAVFSLAAISDSVLCRAELTRLLGGASTVSGQHHTLHASA